MRRAGPRRLQPANGTRQKVSSAHGLVRAKTEGIIDTALRVFQAAKADGVSPAVTADRMAEERMAAVGRLAMIRLPRDR